MNLKKGVTVMKAFLVKQDELPRWFWSFMKRTLVLGLFTVVLAIGRYRLSDGGITIKDK